jgi:hypothetical protein
MRRVLLLVVVPLLFVPRAAWSQGTPLGPEFRVNTYTTGYQLFPAVAADAAGNFVVVWSAADQDGSSYGPFGQRYSSSGAPIGPEFQVNTFTTGPQVGVHVACDSSGNFVIVWNSSGQDGSQYGVFGQRYDSSGARIGPEFRINTYTTATQNQSAVASDGAGDFVVAWVSNGQDGAGNGVFGQRYASSGSPLGPEFRVNTYTTGAQDRPKIASDASGNFVVVWQSPQDGAGSGIFAQRYASSGAPLGSEFRVNTYTTNNQKYPAVAADASGNFVVVWQSPGDGSSYGVFGQRYASSGAPLGPVFRVNTYTPTFQGYPAVAADASGNFVVIWQGDQPGSIEDVFGQRYVNTGAPDGPEFRVNTYTTGPQFRPAVAADSAGDFVVVWVSQGQDGSYDGIFGQRYGQIVPVELMRFTVE